MSENRRILKNSIALYLSLLVKTLVGLYSARIVLLELGVADYGLYAVVAGIVAMMGFASTAMLTTSYRFIAVEIGKGINGNVNRIFNASLFIHIILALLLFIIGETIGIWYIRTYLNVVPNKISDALFVLHFSMAASAFAILSVPFNGLISAKENFIIRASVDIISILTNLGLVLILTLYVGNKLRAYSIIMAIVNIIPLILLSIYTKVKYRSDIQWRFNNKISDYTEMLGFTGWALIGVISYISVRQGAAVIINLFFGTAVNAAFGIGSQINNYVMTFVKNLNQAAVPQIMKSHAGGDSERSMNLVYYISKYAFFIILIFVVPFFLSIDSILQIWLKEVPEFTRQFAILIIVNGSVSVTSTGLDVAIQATGKIRKAQIWFSILMLMNLPIAYVLFKYKYPPYSITVILIVATIIYRMIQINILTKITEFKTSVYWKLTVIPVFLVCISTIPQFFIRKYFGQDLISVIVFSTISITLTLLSVYLLGLTKKEKAVIQKQFDKALIRIGRH